MKNIISGKKIVRRVSIGLTSAGDDALNSLPGGLCADRPPNSEDLNRYLRLALHEGIYALAQKAKEMDGKMFMCFRFEVVGGHWRGREFESEFEMKNGKAPEAKVLYFPSQRSA